MKRAKKGQSSVIVRKKSIAKQMPGIRRYKFRHASAGAVKSRLETLSRLVTPDQRVIVERAMNGHDGAATEAS